MVVACLSPHGKLVQKTVSPPTLLSLFHLVIFICHFTQSNHGSNKEKEEAEGGNSARVIADVAEGIDDAAAAPLPAPPRLNSPPPHPPRWRLLRLFLSLPLMMVLPSLATRPQLRQHPVPLLVLLRIQMPTTTPSLPLAPPLPSLLLRLSTTAAHRPYTPATPKE